MLSKHSVERKETLQLGAAVRKALEETETYLEGRWRWKQDRDDARSQRYHTAEDGARDGSIPQLVRGITANEVDARSNEEWTRMSTLEPGIPFDVAKLSSRRTVG